MNPLSIALTNYRNDLKDSDGKLLFITQAILVFFLLTLSLTGASIQSYLRGNLEALLGADIVVSSFDPLSKDAIETLGSISGGFSQTRLVTLTLANGESWQRTRLKVVDAAYPLQGELTIGDKQSGTQTHVSHGPAVGEIWLGPRLISKLDLTVGETLQLGETTLKVGAALYHEPDRLMEGHSVEMRAMINAAAFDTSVIEGTGVRHRLMLQAEAEQAQTIENWVNDNLPAAQVLKKRGGSHPLALFWTRTENFLGLAAVLIFFMAAVAIDMTNRRQIARQTHRLAVYMSFGTKLGHGLRIAGLQWFIGYFIAAILGTAAAYAAQAGIISVLSPQFPGIESGLHPVALGKTLLLTTALLIAFQVPALLQLSRASILSLFRNEESQSAVIMRLFWGFGALALLAAHYSDNGLLTAMVLAAMGAALVLMLVLTWAVLAGGDQIAKRKSGLLPFSFFLMKQRLFSKATQITGLGLCSLLLLFSLMLMRDIGTSMENYTRKNDGNLLISEAKQGHMDALHLWAEETNSVVRQLRTFTSAQLIFINDKTLTEHTDKPSDSMATVQSPIRLSWTGTMPKNNYLVDGTMWETDEKNWNQISVEDEIVTDLGLSFGDTLTFQIDGRRYDFQLTASHAYKSGGGSITFWFQAPHTFYKAVRPPVRYMGSMELPAPAWDQLGALWQQFPDISMVPLKEMTKRFDDTLALVTKLTVGFASMILLMAAIVIAASVKGFEDDDRKKNGLLLSMGLKSADCLRLNLYEWAITAIIASCGAVAGTWLAGALIYQSQFSIAYVPNPVWLLSTSFLVIAVVVSIGLVYCRNSLKASVKDLLAN